MTKLLDSDESESEDGGAQIALNPTFTVNEDFARRFAHNKKREELRRLEDKFAQNTRKRKRPSEESGEFTDSATSSSSESEDEDDAAELATEHLDAEINATLSAIRSKDPRVYDQRTTFYSNLDEQNEQSVKGKEAKPMYLRDYHRENLLNSKNFADGIDEKVALTYHEEQEALKRSVVSEINAAAAAAADKVANNETDEDEASDDGFLVTKNRSERLKVSQVGVLDVEQADKDPETFLSNFMASRAWVSTEQSRFQPFESDDEDEDRRAEEFEQAYNFRFEDPAKSNEKLTSHARDVASKHSVRREEENARKKRRTLERERKEAAKKELAEEKARLRKLKIEDVQEKLGKIKRAAGLRGKDLNEEEWARFLDDSWDDAKWEEEMRKRFGEAYYGEEDIDSEVEQSEVQVPRKTRMIKKPKWDDDIDIGDIVPEFDGDERPAFVLSEDETSQSEVEMPQSDGNLKSQKPSKGYKTKRREDKKEARKERKMIEQLVDKKLEIDTALLGGSSKKGGFRYRETSPVSYGLSARDILLAPDSQLNEYVGLKKLATFRDPEKKRRDRKLLGKKARLRKWRQETFGDEEGLNNAKFVHIPPNSLVSDNHPSDLQDGVDIREDGGRRRRRKKPKNTS